MGFYGSSMEREAFTLIELIIVILIISLMGFLVFSEVAKQEEKKEVISPTTLASSLRKAFPSYGEFEFLCTHKSTKCYIAKEMELSPYEGVTQLGTNLEVYMMDKRNQLVHIEEFGRIKDDKITIRFRLYANGSSTQMVLANDEGVYFLPSYFGEPQQVESLDEARELWLKEDFDIDDSGNYY